MFAGLIGTVLVVYLGNLFSKKFAITLADDEIGLFEKIIYNAGKWVVILFAVAVGLHLLFSWPPHWLEKIHQRKIVTERAQSAGGWKAIKKDCAELIQSNGTNIFWWTRYDTNAMALPSSLMILRPRRIEISPEPDGMFAVRIQIFGMHATGMRGQDYYSIKVICPRPASIPPPRTPPTEVKVRNGDKCIADSIYEIASPD